MSDKKVKSDPLLGEDESQATAPEAVKPAKVEAKPAEAIKPVEAAPRVLTPIAQIKADALAKFPGDTVAQTKYILDNSEHIDFLVPQLEGESGEETVQINGYKLTIKKNVPVSIPKQVAAIIAEKYKINMEAGKEKRTDRASDVADALS